MGRRLLASIAGSLVAWIGSGTSLTTHAAATPPSFAQARNHWAFQPVASPPIPAVRNRDLVRTPIDAFLLEKLEERGLRFAPSSDPRTALRRVYLDLIGLPPSFEEVEAFANDPSDTRWNFVVDRLLADPRHGERWGRHWLDVARYADTKDLVLLYGRDALRPYAYTYRDYVVRAFNDDLPFDAFVRDQIAADLVEPRVEAWRLAAMGFLTLGRLFDNNPHDQIDDQIDTLGRGFLGLTLACARCHDHKSDAIVMEDYYGLYGVFASTERPYVLPLIEDPAAVPDGAAFEERLAKARDELEKHIDADYAKLSENFRSRLGDYLVRAATTKPDLTETTQFFVSLTPEDFRPGLMLKTRRYLARRVRVDDPVFGPWAALSRALPSPPEASDPSAESGERTDAIPTDRALSELETAAVRHGWNRLVVGALIEAAPHDISALARAYGNLFRSIYEASKTGDKPDATRAELLEVVLGNDGPVSFERRDTHQHMSRPEKDKYGSLVLALDKLAAHATNPPPARAMVVSDLPERHVSRVFLRGSPSRPDRPAPQGFLRVLGDGTARRFVNGSGRLELANAVADPKNPLTARVFMNRIWMHHFGEPLVRSPGDFGAKTEPPSHPKLLDWLASDFMQGGWRLKRIHRLVVTSSAYRQGSILGTDLERSGLAADPENRLLWRFPRRRLDVESMRDSMLAVSGRLDPKMGGRPVDVAGDPENRRRTLYGLVDRQNLPGFFRSFDFAIPDQCVEKRPRTTVAQQALFALNAPFVQLQALALAEQPAVLGASNDEERVEGLFRKVLARNPSPLEKRAAVEFLNQPPISGPPGTNAWTPLAQLAQVLLVSNEAVHVE